MSLSIVLVRRDAEKLKFFNFAASLKIRVADDVEKNAFHMWFAATGRQEKRDKCESTLSMFPYNRRCIADEFFHIEANW